MTIYNFDEFKDKLANTLNATGFIAIAIRMLAKYYILSSIVPFLLHFCRKTMLMRTIL